MATARKFGAAEVAGTLSRNAQARASSPIARVWLALITVYLLWGSTYLGIKFSIETIPPLLMGALRFLIAGGVLFVVATRARESNGTDALGWAQWRAPPVILA